MNAEMETALRNYADRVERHRDELPRWNEDEVKGYLIEPLLRALGWDPSDPSSVRHQFPVTMGTETKKADYALMLRNTAICIVDAKAGELDEDAARQALSYALNLRAPWALVANGPRLRLYGAEFFTSQNAMNALIMDIEISSDTIDASVESLRYLAKGTLDSEEVSNVFKSMNNRRALLVFLQDKKHTLVRDVIGRWIEQSWGKGPVDETDLLASLEIVFGRIERVEPIKPEPLVKLPSVRTVVTAGDWQHKPERGKGVFVLKTDPNKWIDVSKPAREVERRLAELGLGLSTPGAIHGFYHRLREIARLIK